MGRKLTKTRKWKVLYIVLYRRDSQIDMFLFLHENIYCGYLLESPQETCIVKTYWNCLCEAIPMNTHNMCCHGENKKNISFG